MTDEELTAHLIATRIAGNVATSRESNVSNIDKLLAADENYHFGVTLTREWTAESLLDLMARRVGVDPDPKRRTGADTIDPALTIIGLEAAAERIAKLATPGSKVLMATGHPTGLLAMYLPIAAALKSRDVELLTPCDGKSIPGMTGWLRYAGDIAMAANGCDLLHSHRAEPMRLMLKTLGDVQPDLVIADHGWAGTAANAGLATIGFADCNDPGVFVAAEQGLDIVAVPLDDNVLATTSYAPLSERLLSHF